MLRILLQVLFLLAALALAPVWVPLMLVLEYLGRHGHDWAVGKCRHCGTKYRWGTRACECKG